MAALSRGLTLLVLALRSLASSSVGSPRKLLDMEVLQTLPKSRCPENTYLLDWGSSGMKVHSVHISSPGQHPTKSKVVKIVGMGSSVPHAFLIDALGNLSAKLTDGHVGGAVFATAGFRLHPDLAHKTWQRVREWNTEHKLFALCSLNETKGCHTLAGSREAAYEMKGMRERASRKHTSLAPPFSMASCGGASIQLGFWGLSPDDLGGCIKDLGLLSDHYDKARTHLRSDKKGAFFSWLANHEAPLSIKGRSDYDAGGVDEMRARYDDWLHQSQESTNPCVSPEAKRYYSTGGVCHRIAGANRTCLKDRWGSYMTRLPGRPNPSRQTCRQSVQSFLQDDVMLSAWHSSLACRAIARKTLQWHFLSAFSREGQLGADLDGNPSWAHVRDVIDKKPVSSSHPLETPEELESHMPGKYLTSVLLTSFLDRVGLNPKATVEASKADVADVVIEEHGFSPGWVTKCNSELLPATTQLEPSAVVVTDPPSSTMTTTTSQSAIKLICPVPLDLQVVSSDAVIEDAFSDSNAFRADAVVEVRCRPGFTGPRHSWNVTCVRPGKWEVLQDADASRIPRVCTPITCETPLDELGVWLGLPGYNETLELRCADGYEPAGGLSILSCLDGGKFRNFATCAASGSNGGSWRTRVYHNGLLSLVGLVVVVVVVVAACWREPGRSPQMRTESQQLMEQDQPVATMEME